MAEDKGKKVETRSMKGSWDVKYNWRFDVAVMERYVAGLKEKKIMGTRCPKCGRIYAPPTALCGKCYLSLSEWAPVKDEATLVMYTVAYTSITGEAYKTPEITGMIRFDGSDSWVIATVKQVDPEKVQTGMKLKAVWRDKPLGQLGDIQYFVPAE